MMNIQFIVLSLLFAFNIAHQHDCCWIDCLSSWDRVTALSQGNHTQPINSTIQTWGSSTWDNISLTATGFVAPSMASSNSVSDGCRDSLDPNSTAQGANSTALSLRYRGAIIVGRDVVDSRRQSRTQHVCRFVGCRDSTRSIYSVEGSNQGALDPNSTALSLRYRGAIIVGRGVVGRDVVDSLARTRSLEIHLVFQMQHIGSFVVRALWVFVAGLVLVVVPLVLVVRVSWATLQDIMYICIGWRQRFWVRKHCRLKPLPSILRRNPHLPHQRHVRFHTSHKVRLMPGHRWSRNTTVFRQQEDAAGKANRLHYSVEKKERIAAHVHFANSTWNMPRETTRGVEHRTTALGAATPGAETMARTLATTPDTAVATCGAGVLATVAGAASRGAQINGRGARTDELRKRIEQRMRDLRDLRRKRKAAETTPDRATAGDGRSSRCGSDRWSPASCSQADGGRHRPMPTVKPVDQPAVYQPTESVRAIHQLQNVHPIDAPDTPNDRQIVVYRPTEEINNRQIVVYQPRYPNPQLRQVVVYCPTEEMNNLAIVAYQPQPRYPNPQLRQIVVYRPTEETNNRQIVVYRPTEEIKNRRIVVYQPNGGGGSEDSGGGSEDSGGGSEDGGGGAEDGGGGGLGNDDQDIGGNDEQEQESVPVPGPLDVPPPLRRTMRLCGLPKGGSYNETAMARAHWEEARARRNQT